MNKDFLFKMREAGYFDPNSDNYFWVNDMEWLDKDKTDNYSGGLPKTAKPFAVTGGGDVWYKSRNGKIFLYYHDDEEKEEYADCLENAVYKAVILYLSDVDFDTDGDTDNEFSEAYAREYIVRCADIFGGYWTTEQTERLKKIADDPLTEYIDGNYKHKSFLSAEQADDIIKQFVGETYSIADTECGISETAACQCNADSNPDVTEFVSDDKLIELRTYCLGQINEYINSGMKFYNAVMSRMDKKRMQEKFYKNGGQNIFITRPNIVFQLGKMDEGTLKKTVEECKSDFVKYYTDENGSPVFSEEYFCYKEGKSPVRRTFYLKDDNRAIAVTYMLMENDTLSLSEIKENTYDSKGRITSYLSYSEYSISFAEHYVYNCDLLEKSNCAETMRLYGDDQTEFTGDDAVKNSIDSARRISYRYIYDNGIITRMTGSKASENEIFPVEYHIEKKAYKALVKRGLI